MSLDQTPRRMDFSDAQLKLVRRSVARLCTPAEFDEFMAVAAQCGLDPLRRQIAPLIVCANDAERRRLIPWTTIDGLRVIAARNRDYRPMEGAPVIEYDRARIDDARNPLGIVRAEVRAWKAFDGAWHPVVGEAWWDEYAPMRRAAPFDRQDETAQSAEGRPDEKSSSAEFHLEPAWRRMGRVMIAKCAEAQALRRGWPDLLSGLYGEEELSASRLSEHTASELLISASHEQNRKRMATRTLWFIAKPGASFEPVAACDVESFVGRIYQAAEASDDIRQFDNDNRASLATYWEWMPQDAFRLKTLSETLQISLSKGGEKEDRSETRSVGVRAQVSECDTRAVHQGAEYE